YPAAVPQLRRLLHHHDVRRRPPRPERPHPPLLVARTPLWRQDPTPRVGFLRRSGGEGTRDAAHELRRALGEALPRHAEPSIAERGELAIEPQVRLPAHPLAVPLEAVALEHDLRHREEPV